MLKILKPCEIQWFYDEKKQNSEIKKKRKQGVKYNVYLQKNNETNKKNEYKKQNKRKKNKRKNINLTKTSENSKHIKTKHVQILRGQLF